MITAGVCRVSGCPVRLTVPDDPGNPEHRTDYYLTSEEANRLVRQIQQALQYAGAEEPVTTPADGEDRVYCIYADVDVTRMVRSRFLLYDLESFGIDTETHVSLAANGRLAVENVTDRQYRLCRELLRRCPEIRVTDVVVPEGVRP